MSFSKTQSKGSNRRNSFRVGYQMVTDGWLRSLLTILPIALMSDASFLSAAGTANREVRRWRRRSAGVCQNKRATAGERESFAELASWHSTTVWFRRFAQGDNAAQSEGRERGRNSHRRFSSIMTMPTRSYMSAITGWTGLWEERRPLPPTERDACHKTFPKSLSPTFPHR